MPSLALIALALASTSLVSAVPVPLAGSWWQNSDGSRWQPSAASWGSWTAPSGGAPEWQPSGLATESSLPNVPTSAPAGPAPQPTMVSAPPTYPSSQPTMPSNAPSVPSNMPNTPSNVPSVPSIGPSAPSVPSSVPTPALSPSSAPSPSPSVPSAPSPSGSSSGSGSIDASYYPTPGDGSASAFDSFFNSKIVDFETLWSAWHSAIMTNNANNAQAVQWLHDAIASNSASSGISGALLLSVIMQESSGIIAVGGTTDASGGSSGGMMQCSGCPSVASLAAASSNSINAMISGGVAHLQGNMAAAGNDQWTALRLYNSGSLKGNNLSDASYGPASTPAYVTDIANRMHGWIH